MFERPYASGRSSVMYLSSAIELTFSVIFTEKLGMLSHSELMVPTGFFEEREGRGADVQLEPNTVQ